MNVIRSKTLNFQRLLVVLLLMLTSQPVFAGKADLLASSTMGENISGGFGDFNIQSRAVFTAQSREVIWFGQFKGFMEAYQANLIADWITPAGETFKKEKFTTQYGNARFGWAKLDIKGTDSKALELEGEWTIKVYWDEDLIDTLKFRIGEVKYTKLPAPDVSTVGGSMRLAKAYYAKEEMNKAIEQLLIAETLDPNQKEAYLLLGTIYNFVGKPEDAISQFSKAYELGADEVAIHHGLSDAYAKLDLMGDAIKEQEAVIALKPDSAEEKQKLADLQKQKTEMKTSGATTPKKSEQKDFLYIGETKIPIVAESNSRYILKLNNEYFSTSNKSMAEDDRSNETLKAAGDCSAMKAQDYLFGSNRRNAFEIYEKCAEKYPMNVGINRAAGVVAMILDEREKCLSYFAKVIQELPDDPLAKEQYGDALMLNLRTAEAKEQYEKAIQAGHHDAERIRIKISKLTPKTDINYIKQYLLGYQGISIEDSLPAYVIYFDTKNKPHEKDYIYKRVPQPENIALVDLQKIRKEFSQWKQLDEYVDSKEKEYKQKREALEKTVKKADKNEALKTQLIKLIVESESAIIVSKSNYAKKIEDAIKQISEDSAKTNGYGAVAKTGGEIRGKDISDEILKKLETENSLTVILERLFADAQKEIKLRENNLKPDQFFKK